MEASIRPITSDDAAGMERLYARDKELRGRGIGKALMLSVYLAFAAGLATPGVRAASADPDWTKETDLRLHQKGMAIDSLAIQGADVPGLRHLFVSGRIAARPVDVWAVISSSPDPEEKWPSIKEAVLERAIGDTMDVRYTMEVPVYPDRRYRLRSVADRDRMRLDYEMIPGYGNVRNIGGYWQVIALSDSLSRVIYVLDTDPGVKLVPSFVIDWASRLTIPRTFAYLTELARSHAYSVPGRSGR
jgi:hypothetical protein